MVPVFQGLVAKVQRGGSEGGGGVREGEGGGGSGASAPPPSGPMAAVGSGVPGPTEGGAWGEVGDATHKGGDADFFIYFTWPVSREDAQYLGVAGVLLDNTRKLWGRIKSSRVILVWFLIQVNASTALHRLLTLPSTMNSSVQ